MNYDDDNNFNNESTTTNASYGNNNKGRETYGLILTDSRACVSYVSMKTL